MKLSRFAITILVGSILSSMTIMSCAKSDSTSEVDKSRIEKIVHDYLLDNPQILVEVSKKLQQKQQQEMKEIEKRAHQAIPKYAKTIFNSQLSPSEGDHQANVTVIEFFDYQCSHCKNMTEVLSNIKNNNTDVRIVYKEFPIFGNDSMDASRAALAAAKQQKYKAMHEALMNTTSPLTEKKIMKAAANAGLNVEQLKLDMDSPEVRKELEQNLELSQKLGLLGTPAFIIGSTHKGDQENSVVFFIPGSLNEEMIQTYIEKVRQDQ